MKTKYIVWIKEQGQTWEPNGDGPVTEKQAFRIAFEIRKECCCKTLVLPEHANPSVEA